MRAAVGSIALSQSSTLSVLREMPSRVLAVLTASCSYTASAANDDDHAIIETYGAQYRGLVNYYLLAGGAWRLNRVRWVMATSLLKTLACKYDSTVSKMAARYTAAIPTPHGPRTCLQATITRTGRKPLTATFGGIPLRRQRKAALDDRTPPPDLVIRRKEPISRLRAGRCEMCEQHNGTVEVHQVAKLAHLGQPGTPRPPWAELMARKRRKTLVVCAACHDTIHHRQPTATTTGQVTGEPDNRKRLCPVRRGPSGKGPAIAGTSLDGLPGKQVDDRYGRVKPTRSGARA